MPFSTLDECETNYSLYIHNRSCWLRTRVSFLIHLSVNIFFFFNVRLSVCQLLATRVRDVVDVFEICECSKSVDKGIRKISKNNFVLWGTQTTIEILRVQNVPFEGTDLPQICALLNARKHSLGSRVKHFENGRIFRETDTSLKFAFFKRTTPRNYPVLRRNFFEISSVKL